jgi:prephenate dehydrogenase (NADP+)
MSALPLYVEPNVSPDSPVEKQPVLGIIGMGAMGRMYANYLANSGWKRYVSRLKNQRYPV